MSVSFQSSKLILEVAYSQSDENKTESRDEAISLVL
jgi:hypothetical protein